MSSKRIKLEPCPFCGGEAVRKDLHFKAIACKKCGASTRYFARLSDATRSWNKRACSKKECKKACKK